MKLKPNEKIRYSLEVNGIYDPSLFGMQSFIELVLSRYPENKHFFPTVFQYLKEAGFSGLELSFGPGSMPNILDTYGSGKEFVKVLDGEGLALSSGFFTDVIFAAPTVADVERLWLTGEKQNRIREDLKVFAGFLSEAGCCYMPVNPPIRMPDTTEAEEMRMVEFYNELGRITAAEGVKFLIHNESNSMVWTQEDLKKYMPLFDPKYVGLCPDIAHFRDRGGRPDEVLCEYADVIPVMHWKDCVKQIPDDIPIVPNLFELHNEYYTRLGDGLVDLPACAEALKETDWSGWIVLEIPVGEGTKNIDASIEQVNSVF